MAGLRIRAGPFVKRRHDPCGPAPAEGLEETVAWTEGRIRDRISGMNGADAVKAVHDMLSASFALPIGDDPAFSSNGVTVPGDGFSDVVTSMALGCLESAGVECARVDGTFGTGTGIAGRRWLQADTGDGWHHLDIAGDILLSTERAPLRYDYYNLSDSEIAADHAVLAAPHGCPVPGCDYYRANGLYVDDFDAFKRILAGAMRRKRSYLAVRLPQGVRPDEMLKKLTIASAEVCTRHVNGRFEMGTSMNSSQMVFVVTVVRERRQSEK